MGVELSSRKETHTVLNFVFISVENKQKYEVRYSHARKHPVASPVEIDATSEAWFKERAKALQKMQEEV